MMKIVIRTFFCLVLSLIVNHSGTSQQTINHLREGLPCLDRSFNLRCVVTVDSTFRLPHVSDSEVDSILRKASEYFAPICMSMKNCGYETLPNYSYSELADSLRIEEMGILYHYSNRITVFFVKHCAGNKCGYSKYNKFNSLHDARIFIELNCADGPAEQLAHHLGRLLGLLDTNHEASTEKIDGSNCATAGDRICDTPADPYGMAIDSSGNWIPASSLEEVTYNAGCEFIWDGQDENGQYYSPSTFNIMSPYNCKCEFTVEQYLKMAHNYSKSDYKQY